HARKSPAAAPAPTSARPAAAAGVDHPAGGRAPAARLRVEVDVHSEPAITARADLAAEDRGQQADADRAEEDREPDREEDDDDPGVDVDRPVALAVALGARLELGAVPLEHHDDVIDRARNAAGIIAGAEGGHHRVLDDELGVQVSQRAFKAIANLDAHLAVFKRDEE